MTPGNPIEAQFELYLKSQDARDLAPVFEALSPRLISAARRAGLDRQGAEDAVQESFLAVIEASDRFESGKPFIPWIHGIALRQIRAERRRRARLLMIFRSNETEDAGEETDHEAVNTEELRQQVNEALRSLSKSNREVVHAALFDGSSVDELSERFNLTKTAASVRLHRGLRQLRERLDSLGDYRK